MADRRWRSRIVEQREMSIAELRSNPLNWRKHPRGQQQALAGVLDDVGIVQGVVFNRRTGRLIDGHLRVELASRCGEDTLPVTVVDLEEAEERLVLATLDPIGALAERDDATLAKLLEETSASNVDLQKLLDELRGEQAATEVDVEPQVNRADELRGQWKTETGQLWKLGEHRLLCGDSTNVEDVARVMGNDKATMCWTDPPYGVEYVGKTDDALTMGNDSAEAIDALLAAAFGGIDTALEDGGAIYIAHPPGALSVAFATAFMATGWRLHQTLVWLKDVMVLGHADYHYKHEPILYGYKPTHGRRGRGGAGWYGDNSQTSVFEVPRPSVSREHPTMKPVELVVAALKNSSPPGALVFDPFCGSGTTIIACEQTHRRARCIEISPGYVAVALQRWADATSGTAEIVEGD